MSATTVIPLILVGYQGNTKNTFSTYEKVSYTRAGVNGTPRYATACYIPEEYRSGLRRMYNNGSIESISITLTWTRKSGGGNPVYYGRKLLVNDTHCEMEDFDDARRINLSTNEGTATISTLLNLGYPAGEAWVFGGNAQYSRYVDILTATITVVSSDPVPAGGFNGKLMLGGSAKNISSAQICVDGTFHNVSAVKVFRDGTWK